MYITEPSRRIPVCYEADLCVVGGSCTGVFAAVRAARLGLKVVIVEKQNCFGGVATAGLVNIWHSLYDVDGKNQIIAGLSHEVIERLKKTDAVRETAKRNFQLNPNNLKVELDNLIKEHKIKAYLHTYYSALACDGNRITHAIIENKDGRSAIKANFFIDATGDGDLARDLRLPSYVGKSIQPPTSCFFMLGDMTGINLGDLVEKHGEEFGVDNDWGWSTEVPGLDNITLRADTHVYNVLCSRADDLTHAEMEGRRQADAIVRMLNKYSGRKFALVNTCSHIGIRETVHYKTRYMANERALLTGKRYESAVLNGTYRVDIHHSHDNGITFKYLDGTTATHYGKNEKIIIGSWRDEHNYYGESTKYYQLPFENLIQEQCVNFIAVGRMIHADEGAFGALRVMINLNQLGEAAGVASWLSLHRNRPIQEIDGVEVRSLLKQGGSAL